MGAASPSALPHASLANDHGPLHLAVVVTLVLIALLVYSLRVYTRARLFHAFDFDDALMSLAAVCCLDYQTTETIS